MNTSSHQEIIKEIVRTTAMIYKQFPELYENLSETPLHGHCDMNDMYKEELSGYLESLTTQWSSYCKVHQIRRFTSDANYLKHYIHLISSNATASSLPWVKQKRLGIRSLQDTHHTACIVDAL